MKPPGEGGLLTFGNPREDLKERGLIREEALVKNSNDKDIPGQPEKSSHF